MFGKSVTITCIGVSAVILTGLFKICFVTDRDILKYKALIEECKKMEVESQNSVATQTRIGVRKDIFFAQEDNSRLHYRIDSSSSLLTMSPENNKLEILENLSNVQCWMQEKLYSIGNKSMQQMRHLQASKGVYNLSKQEFIANDVMLSLFRIPGHELTTTIPASKAFLKGKAEDIEFTVSGKTPRFEAHQFNASFTPEGQNP